MYEESEDHKARPPRALKVARQGLILSAVVCRSFLEEWPEGTERDDTHAWLLEWLDLMKLRPHLEPDEKWTLDAKLGELPKRLYVQGTWHCEGLAILSWALQLADFPPHDQKVSPVAITRHFQLMEESASEILESAKLRPRAELEAAREWFYSLHCNLRQFLFYNGTGEVAAWNADYLHTLGLSPEELMPLGRLAFRGKPLSEAERGELEEWECVIRERHRASIWLEDASEAYTELAVDT